MDALKSELEAKATALLRVKDINCLATGYDEMLKQSLDAHILEKMITITLHPRNPWFSNELNQLKRAMRSLERRWVRNKSDENWADYKELRNVYCRKLRQAKRQLLVTKSKR